MHPDAKTGNSNQKFILSYDNMSFASLFILSSSLVVATILVLLANQGSCTHTVLQYLS